MLWKSLNPAFRALLETLAAQHATIYLVGGVVRDLLLGRVDQVTDLDLVTDHHNPLALARRAADQLGWAYYPLDEARDVARLVFQPGTGEALVCDLAGLRADSLEADLRLRDFTINAMALPLPLSTARLIDPCHGETDLHRGLIRRISSLSLADDPIRLLRAVRLACQLGFTIEADTAAQIRRLADYLSQVSVERVRDELWKTLTSARPVTGINLLEELGLLRLVLPEVAAMHGVGQSVPHTRDVYHHTLAAVEYAAALSAWIFGADGGVDAELAQQLAPWRYQLRRHLALPLAAGHTRAGWLVWHALLHDIGKPATRSEETDESGRSRVRFLGHEEIGAELAAIRLKQLRFSRPEISLAATVIRHHMRPHHLHTAFPGAPISRRATYRFFRDTGGRLADTQAGIDILLLALADRQAIYGELPPDWKAYLEHVASLLVYAFDMQAHRPAPLINGHQLMQHFNLQPGAQLAALLDHLVEAQMLGELRTTDDALHKAKLWLDEARPTVP